MRTLLCWLVLISMAAAADWKIDHATIAGPRLDHLRRLLSAVGIPTEYGGPHSNGLTEMAITAFPDGSYLELIAWRDARAPHAGASWRKFIDSQGGPCAWAIHMDDVSAETRRLTAAGIETTQVARSGRTRPDGVKLEWETAGIGPGDRGSLLPFLIHDFTPRERRVYPAGKPTTTPYKGIFQIVIAVRDLEEAVSLYRRAFTLPDPDRQQDRELAARRATFPGTPIVLATPLSRDSWLAARLEKFGEAPCAFVLAGRTPGTSIRWFDPARLEGIRLGIQ